MKYILITFHLDVSSNLFSSWQAKIFVTNNDVKCPSQVYILYKTRIRLQIEIGMDFDQ